MAADYDFVVQLHHSVARDVQVRTINASLLSNLAVTSLTLEGNVFADCQPEVATTKDRQPGATLMAPSMLNLDLTDLKLSYEGDDESLSRVGSTIEHQVLRRVSR